MDMDSPAFLGKSCHLHHAGGFAINMGSHRQHRANGHNPRAPDTRDDDIVGAVDHRHVGIRHIRQFNRGGGLLFQLRARHCDKRWAEPRHTGKIFVAR